MNKYIVFLLSLSITYGGAYMNLCEPNWFGANCEFACHCKYGPCTAYGQCIESGDLCEDGWFGYLCQYRDALPGATVETSNPDVSPLIDNNPNTCSEITLVRITLSEPLTFTFLRLVLNSEVGNNSFSLGLLVDNAQMITHNAHMVNCADVKNFTHETNVDLSCKMSSVHQILIEWRGQLSVCSIYVSRGRNLALKQKVSISSDEHSKFSKDLGSSIFAVDGVKADLSDASVNCTSTSALDKKPTLFIFLGIPQSISSVIITSLKGHTEGMKGFQLSLYGETLDPVIYTYEQHVQLSQNNTVFTIHVNASAIIRKIEISLLKKKTQKDALFICEIEAFGDCGYPNYGLQCEDICSYRCTDLDCHVTGECWKCDEGYYGVYCEKGTKEVEDKPMDDDHGPKPENTTPSENVSRLLTFIFVVFGATIVMEIAGLVHLRYKQKDIVQEARKSLKEMASDIYVPYIYAADTPMPDLDDDKDLTPYTTPEPLDSARNGSSV